jgi:hypothetical protein
VRVNLVVVGDPADDVLGFSFGTRIDAHKVSLDCPYERFGHSVALRAFDRRRPQLETDAAGEAAYEPILYGWKDDVAHYWCGARDQGDI